MPKGSKRDAEKSRATILAAADVVLRKRGARATTVDSVAKQADCAKGLVLYHFKTKRDLLEAAARQLSAMRAARWRTALDKPDPMGAVDETWDLLTDESASGISRAWVSLLGPGKHIADQAVRELHEEFSSALGSGVLGLLERMGTSPRVAESELGWLLATIANGMGLSLLAGADRHALNEAYAAAWLGILSLGTARR